MSMCGNCGMENTLKSDKDCWNCGLPITWGHREVDKAIQKALSGALDSVSKIKQAERDKCRNDVCMYCGGRALGYNRTPTGPNDAGNYIHTSNGAAGRILSIDWFVDSSTVQAL